MCTEALNHGGQSHRNPNDVPVLFVSRRIGLTGGREAPIDIGGGVTGKAGPYRVGLLNIRISDEPLANARTTNFAVVRIKRDVPRRSALGAMLTDRSAPTSTPTSRRPRRPGVRATT